MSPVRLALVGLGKIARDQHLPAIAATPGIELAAIASRNASLDGVPHFTTLEALLASDVGVDAVALCTPPQGRREQAELALSAGKHVLLEKPPGATVSEIGPLAETARENGLTLFATWHSRFAPAVEPARTLLAQRQINTVDIVWKEDVRVWHPGQTWIWRAGGFGVFDPGINALSILTRIMPNPVVLKSAELFFPVNCETPVAANLTLDAGGASIGAEFDFLQTGPQTWEIDIETDAGRLLLSRGGSLMHVNGNPVVVASDREYPRLYAHFETLIRERRSDVDVAPLRLVADAFLSGRRVTVAPFIE